MTAGSSLAHTLIVSRNADTALRLRSYFDQCGVASTVTDQIVVPPDSGRFTAVLVFPDEFPEQAAMAGICDLASRCPRAWIVVVTRNTARFEQLLAAAGVAAPGHVLVLPRPVWGWALLDRVLQPPPQTTDP